jgi:cation transport protein ChaC
MLRRTTGTMAAMLTRELISTGDYLRAFETLPDEMRWSNERIIASMRETLKARPTPGKVWLFGYGSLIWNPLLKFDGRQPATLEGWHRSFCIRLVTGRGCAVHPGRMLALEHGGETQGMAFSIADEDLEEELRLVWIREMPTGVYLPTWAPIRLADGSHASALVFVANDKHALHERDTRVPCIAPLIAAATGPLGTNADYVIRLEAALSLSGMNDEYISALASALRESVSNTGTAAPALPGVA